MDKKKIYSQIEAKIVRKLLEGTVPWKKKWAAGLPANYLTKKVYSGINFLSLLGNDYPSPYYLSFLQCKEMDGRVLKGSSGHLIVFWKLRKIDAKDESGEEETKEIPIIRATNVFNLSQTTLYCKEEPQIMSCERLLSSMKIRPEVRNNPNRCYYSAT